MHRRVVWDARVERREVVNDDEVVQAPVVHVQPLVLGRGLARHSEHGAPRGLARHAVDLRGRVRADVRAKARECLAQHRVRCGATLQGVG